MSTTTRENVRVIKKSHESLNSPRCGWLLFIGALLLIFILIACAVMWYEWSCRKNGRFDDDDEVVAAVNAADALATDFANLKTAYAGMTGAIAGMSGVTGTTGPEYTALLDAEASVTSQMAVVSLSVASTKKKIYDVKNHRYHHRHNHRH